MAEVTWSDTAMTLAEEWALDAQERFGVKTKNKLKKAYIDITHRLSLMPRTGPLDDVFADEDGEFRFLHANKALKVCYRVVDEDHIIVFAVLPVRMSTRQQKVFYKNCRHQAKT